MFSSETYALRQAALRAMMADLGLDALLVYGLGGQLNHNLEFVAGPCSTNGIAFVPAVGDSVLFIQPKALVPFVSRTAVCEVRNGGVDYGDELAAEITCRGLDRGAIGLVEVDRLRTRGIPHLLYERLREEFPAARFPTVTEDYERVRLTPMPEARALMERAAHELDRVMDFFTGAIQPGESIAEVISDTKAFARQQGLCLASLQGRAASMNGSPSILDPSAAGHRLKRGDYVFFESSAGVGPYQAYRSFAVALGEPPDACGNLFETAVETAKGVAAALRAGNTAADVIAAGSLIVERGLWCHGPLATGLTTGGSQMICVSGFDGYRTPTPMSYTEGMVFQVFPHVMLPDNSKLTIAGNTVLVTEKGGQALGSQGFRYLVK